MDQTIGTVPTGPSSSVPDSVIAQCASLVLHFMGGRSVAYAHEQIAVHLRTHDLRQLEVWNRIAAMLEAAIAHEAAAATTPTAPASRQAAEDPGQSLIELFRLRDWSKDAYSRLKTAVGF